MIPVVKKKGRKRPVSLVGLPDVDQRQHHEHEGLQRDDQDVKDGPHGARDDVEARQSEPGKR